MEKPESSAFIFGSPGTAEPIAQTYIHTTDLSLHLGLRGLRKIQAIPQLVLGAQMPHVPYWRQHIVEKSIEAGKCLWAVVQVGEVRQECTQPGDADRAPLWR